MNVDQVVAITRGYFFKEIRYREMTHMKRDVFKSYNELKKNWGGGMSPANIHKGVDVPNFWIKMIFRYGGPAFSGVIHARNGVLPCSDHTDYGKKNDFSKF